MQFKYRLVDIEQQFFSFDFKEIIEVGKLDFGFDYFPSIHLESVDNDSFKLNLKVKVNIITGGDDVAGELENDFVFHIIYEKSNLFEGATKKTTSISIPREIALVTFSVAYSTLRGILYEKLAILGPSKPVLNVSNPNSFIPDGDSVEVAIQ